MSFHLIAFEEAVGVTANTDLDAVTDNEFTIQNSHFLPQRDYNLFYAAAMGATIARARIVSPTNRQVTLPFIRPVIEAAAPAADAGVADYRRNPFPIVGLEELAVELTSDIAMGTEQSYALLALGDSLMAAPNGPDFTFRGSSSSAAVANAWTTLSMSWADTLPQGTYSVVGMEIIGAGGIAGRLNFENEKMRPGVLANVNNANVGPDMFLKGGLGEFGRFRSTALPQVEVLCNTTTSSWEVYLDIIRVA